MIQRERVLDYMRKHGSITQKEASKYIAVGRLGARIYDLKKLGFAIKKETVKGKNRYKEETRFARYRLEEESA